MQFTLSLHIASCQQFTVHTSPLMFKQLGMLFSNHTTSHPAALPSLAIATRRRGRPSSALAGKTPTQHTLFTPQLVKRLVIHVQFLEGMSLALSSVLCHTIVTNVQVGKYPGAHLQPAAQVPGASTGAKQHRLQHDRQPTLHRRPAKDHNPM